jgi:signal transduction histidine kinase
MALSGLPAPRNPAQHHLGRVDVQWRPAPTTRTALLTGAAAPTVAGLLSLWRGDLPPAALPTAVVALALGGGFAAAGAATLRRARMSGSLFLLAGVLLSAAPPVRAIGLPALADVASVAAGMLAVPLGLLRIVPRRRGVVVLRAVDATVATAGLGGTAATAAGAFAPTVAAGIVVATAALLGGWVQFEFTAGDDRRAVLWLVLGVTASTLAALLVVFTNETVALGPVALAVVVSVPALVLPLTAAVAVLAPRAADVRAVIGDASVAGVMSALVLAEFGGAQSLIALATGQPPGKAVQGLLAAAVAAGFHPTMVRVRAVMDEVLFGGRPDPVDTLARLGAELAAGSGPREWLDALRSALGVPWLALREDGRVVAESRTHDGAGSSDGDTGSDGGRRTETVALRTGRALVGDLVVALPADQLRLPAATASVLALVAAPLAQAVHAVRLGEQLRASRREVVVALEEERRRTRRDLHDGLGPTLTGIAYSADAAANLVRTDPGQAADLLRGLRADAGEAIAEIRRIVHGLRPRALDELGLAGAVRQQCTRLRAADGRPLRVGVDAPDELGELPAALEVVAYRVAVEAVTNVARHAGVAEADVAFAPAPGHALTVTVRDSGSSDGPWTPGVGLWSMRERVEQIGGTLTVDTGPGGTTVTAVLPLRTPP